MKYTHTLLFHTRYYLFFLTILFFYAPQTSAQIATPIIAWEHNYGGSGFEYLYSVQNTPDGGYIAVGGSTSNDGDVGANYSNSSDYWLLKLDVLGNIEWKKNYGGANNDAATSVQITPDGGYIVAGYSDSNNTGDVGASNGSSDYWLLKLDALGNIQWQHNYGGTANDTGNFVELTPDGGYIVTGYSSSNDGDVGGNNGMIDGWLLKLDAFGNIQWEHNYGGSQNDFINVVRATPDGGYIGAGMSWSNNGDVGGNNGMSDYWLLKLDALGNIQWEKNYGGSSEEEIYAIQVTPEGGYIVAGYSGSSDGDAGGNNGSADYWLLKLDALGNIEWEQNYGGSDYDHAYSVQVTPDSGYIAAGYSQSNNGDVGGNNGSADYWLLKLDALGNIQWEQNYGGSNDDFAICVEGAPDKGYILAGDSNSDNGDVGGNNGIIDYWLLKLYNPLGGTYTIGNSPTATFSSLQDAIDSLSLVGMYKEVVLEVEPGITLNEQVHISNIAGISATSQLIINGNGATLTAAPTANNRDIIQIDGVSHIVIDNLNILTDPAAECSWGIHLKNQADSVYIRNCTIDVGVNATDTCFIGIVASASNTSIAAPDHFGNNANRTIIYNNTIKGGFMGIAICGNQDTTMLGAIIEKNKIEDSYQTGIFVSFQTNTRCKNNEINLKTGARSAAFENPHSTGLHYRYTTSQLEVFQYRVSPSEAIETFTRANIEANKITGASSRGIHAQWTSHQSGDYPYMVNNMVSCQFEAISDTTNAGIFLSNNSDDWQIYYNSVNVTGNGCAVHIKINSDNIDLQSNTLSYINGDQGYSAKIENENSLLEWDYNNYYSENSTGIVKLGDFVYITSVADLPSNANSVSINPAFLTFSDLHINNSSLQSNVANPNIAELFPYDIDGEPRPDLISALPDIGADEYLPTLVYRDTICFMVDDILTLSLPDSLISIQWIQIDNEIASLISTNHTISVPAFNGVSYVGIGNGINTTYAYQYALHPVYNLTQNIALCAGESYNIGTHSYANSGVYIDTLHSAFGCDSIITTSLTITPTVRLKAYLEGTYNLNNANMNTTPSSILPLQQPYNTAPWNYAGTESVSTIPVGAVDWVLIEARQANNPSVVLDRAATWLLNNGNIVSYQNTNQGVCFSTLTNDSSYLFVVRHRNHLAVMSHLPIIVTNTPHTTIDYDFTNAITQAMGNNQLKLIGINTYVLFAGDINGNGVIDAFNDYNTYVINYGYGYKLADLNLNGSSNTSDFNLWRHNLGKLGIFELRY
jgi:hypothetical protein